MNCEKALVACSLAAVVGQERVEVVVGDAVGEDAEQREKAAGVVGHALAVDRKVERRLHADVVAASAALQQGEPTLGPAAPQSPRLGSPSAW
jgi:hypothetical protein